MNASNQPSPAINSGAQSQPVAEAVYGPPPPPCAAGGYGPPSFAQSIQPAGVLQIPPYAGAALQPKIRQPFSATRADGWFAIGCFILGFLYVRWLLFALWQGWGITLFTALFGAMVLGYTFAKRVKPRRESWFWLGILQLTGASFSLFPGGSMGGWRVFLLMGTAVYWCGTLMGGLLEDKTGNLFLLDALNLTVLVPFKNFGTAFKGIAKFSRQKTEGESAASKNKLAPVLVGLLLCIPLFAILIPQLIRADSGSFTSLMESFSDVLEQMFDDDFGIYAVEALLGIPVGLFLCGLVAGLAHKRYTRGLDVKKTRQNVAALRLLPEATVVTVLGIVSLLYLVFIGCQIPYFFSAFAGVRPEGYLIYADYARDGFFELCQITALNLGLLLAANLLCRTPRREYRPLKWLNSLLAALTLLLIATAFSKMVLYIDAYGMTPRRVQTSVFMIFMAVITLGVMALQKWDFSIVRLGAILGAAMLCLLCVGNLDGAIQRYNAERFVEGSLSSFDKKLFYNAGAAGFESGVLVYQSGKLETEDQDELENELRWLIWAAEQQQGRVDDTWTQARIRAMGAELALEPLNYATEGRYYGW